ncbi:MAG: hypothetical protein GF334_10130 [Candidatus Altiarchaeales archaeon]|nr:hypothetical protein [Candidatus Altiarchaeales archaeon]
MKKIEPYSVEPITIEEKDRLLDDLPKYFTSNKADIHGMCVELVTDENQFKEMWEDNFHSMSEYIRPHARIITHEKPGETVNTVYYDQVTKTVFIYNCNYYGYVKSIALAAAGDFLEDYHSVHNRYSVHGSCIDIKGRGCAIIAPSGSGKTTLSYGLLLLKEAKLVSDDWFYVQSTDTDIVAHASEMNSYIREDIGDNWSIFKRLLEDVKLDEQHRGIVDVELAVGKMKTRDTTILRSVFLLKRDGNDATRLRKLKTAEAVEFLVQHDFCNPHQLMRNEYKKTLRIEAFKDVFKKTSVYLLNTAHDTPKKSRQKLIEVIKEEVGLKNEARILP